MALAYSAYDRLLGLEPLDWESKARGSAGTVAAMSAMVALDFPIETVVGTYEHPAYGTLTVRANGTSSRWSSGRFV